MLHDSNLLEQLRALPTEEFKDDVFRATRKGLDPLAFSTRGGRWIPAGDIAALYTSLAEEGALAEISFHWGTTDTPAFQACHTAYIKRYHPKDPPFIAG